MTRSERGRREGRTNDDKDINDVENETSSPELEVSKVQRRIWPNANDNNDIDDGNDDSEQRRGRGMTTMTVNRADHGSMR